MITFTLKSPQSKTPTLIMLCDHFAGRVFRMSTGQFIHPDDWNPVKRRPKTNGSSALTLLLDRLADRVRELHVRMEADGIIVTPASLRTSYQREIRTGGKRENLVEFIARHSGGVNDSLLRLLKLYPKPHDFNDITTSWLSEFHTWLATDYKPSYIAGIISALQRVMKWAASEGLHHNNSYEYRKPVADTDSIYLSESELDKIRKVKLPEHLDRVRDRLLISAYTGLRYSDNCMLTVDSIQDGILRNKNIKTGNQVAIPVHRVVREIMAKYPDGLPAPISIQNANINIKEIGKLAGITTKVEIDGKWVPKYELICTHTFRRSCITNLVLAGLPTQAVMKISGHKTEAAFRRYVRMEVEESAMAIAGHEWFRG